MEKEYAVRLGGDERAELRRLIAAGTARTRSGKAALIVARERAETWIRAASQTRGPTLHFVVIDALSRPPR